MNKIIKSCLLYFILLRIVQTTFAQNPYIVQAANGDLHFSVTFSSPQAFVEVFAQKNGIQNIASDITSNVTGSYTYTYIAPASGYAPGDQIIVRFYSYMANSPGVLTPGPTENDWSPVFTYSIVTTVNSWSLTGNSGTNAVSNFIGTTDAQPLIFKANSLEKLRINPSGDELQVSAFPDPSRSDFRQYIYFKNNKFSDNSYYGVIGSYQWSPSSSDYSGPRHLILQDQPFGQPNNLGIGLFTSAPQAKLHVKGTTALEGNTLIGTSTDFSLSGGQLVVNGAGSFVGNGPAGDALQLFSPAKTTNGGRHYLYLGNRKIGSSNIDYSYIGAYEVDTNGTKFPKHLILQDQFNGGNLGIGYFTTTPVAKLAVNGTTFLNGSVGIGDAYVPSGFMLSVNGKIMATEVQVKLRAKWPDYVFDQSYKLMPLDSVAAYVTENKHLPQVPSANEVNEGGVQLGEMDAILLKKVEELTLYTIEQQKMIKEQQKAMEEQQRLNQELMRRLESLEGK